MTLSPDKTYGHALLLMHDNGFRHMPVVENGRPIGIVSSRNAMDPDLEEFVWEERRREYYLVDPKVSSTPGFIPASAKKPAWVGLQA